MRFSASKSPLLAICMYPFRSDVNAPEAASSKEATVGTVAWARVAAHIEGQADPGNGELAPDEAASCDEYYRAGLAWAKGKVRLGWRCEIKFAWSPSRDEARELPPSKDLRDYYHRPDCPPDCVAHCNGDEVAGSTDLVYFDAEGILVVDDVKTGFTALAQYIPQIRSLGMMAARRFDVRMVRVRLIKLHKDKAAEEWEDILDAFAIDGIAEDLKTRLAAAEGADPVPGSHCTELFCPARLVCPEVPALVAELLPAEALVKAPKFSHVFISHDHDARMLDFARLVEKWADDLKKLIKERTPAVGVVLEDGRILREGFHEEVKWRQEALIGKVKELADRLGLTDEDTDRELELCRAKFQKSEGLKVVKAPKAPRVKAA